MMFGAKTDLAESCRILNRALDAGLNTIDTADIYSRGRSEEFTGEALARSGQRDRVVLCTKFCGAMDPTDPNAQGLSRRHLVRACEASLRRLRTDHLDLYQIHRARPHIALDETLRALDDLVRAGKIRYYGTSTFAAWQVTEALWCAERHGLHRTVCEQPPYNLLDRRIERELLPMAQTHGLGTLVWSPLAAGLLTGKYRAGAPLPAGTRFFTEQEKKTANPIYERRALDASLAVVEQLLPLAAAKNISLSQFALAWVLARPGVSSAIVGPRTLAQFEDNLAALAVTFTAEELRALDELVPPGTHVSPFYEAAFGPHLHRW